MPKWILPPLLNEPLENYLILRFINTMNFLMGFEGRLLSERSRSMSSYFIFSYLFFFLSLENP